MGQGRLAPCKGRAIDKSDFPDTTDTRPCNRERSAARVRRLKDELRIRIAALILTPPAWEFARSALSLIARCRVEFRDSARRQDDDVVTGSVTSESKAIVPQSSLLIKRPGRPVGKGRRAASVKVVSQAAIAVLQKRATRYFGSQAASCVRRYNSVTP
ncbi:hypothetical protein KM043_002904 [Ampulex compressa]|nr:hypothetical protein KM043_002904 [Ampulex compressa]